MTHHTQALVLDVVDGNPGALVITRRLMYFTAWPTLLSHLKAQGLIGSRLWSVVKDEYAHNWTQFAQDQLAEIGLGHSSPSSPQSHPALAVYN